MKEHHIPNTVVPFPKSLKYHTTLYIANKRAKNMFFLQNYFRFFMIVSHIVLHNRICFVCLPTMICPQACVELVPPMFFFCFSLQNRKFHFTVFPSRQNFFNQCFFKRTFWLPLNGPNIISP